MENPILANKRRVAERLEKSFSDGINVPEEVEMEKAHQDGEIHPNGKWVWVSSANGGKGDWRTRGGRTHNAHSENEKKFKQNFKNAKDGILQKIIDGKIQAGVHEKKWAQDILDERKKGSVGEKAARKIIDLIKISSSKYSDINKVVAFKTDKGNWAIDYDGANTGLIIGKDHLSEAELKAAGVKIEGVNANSKKDSDLINDIKSNEDAFIEACGLSDIKRVISIRETSTSVFIKYENESGQEQEFPLTKNVANSVLKEVKSGKSKKADPKQDKVAQAAGFKDYEEMKGWQDYTTAKNLLKKPSMKLKSKEADRKELEKQVADYEKDHADVIAARGGKVTNPKLVAAGETAAKNTAKLFVGFLNGDDESMEFNDHYIKLTQAIPNEEQRKKMVEDAIRKEMHNHVSPGSPDEDKAVKEFWENLDTEAIKGSNKSVERKPAIKYSEMTAAQANKTLVGKTIKIGDKTAKIVNAFKTSGPGNNRVYIDVVDGDDYLGKHMQMSLKVVESGETKYDNKHFGAKGQKIEISDEEPEKKEVTKESFKEFLNYMQKNIAKKDSEEFLNKEYMFLFTVPQKYRSNAGNVHNRVAATMKKLSDVNNW